MNRCSLLITVLCFFLYSCQKQLNDDTGRPAIEMSIGKPGGGGGSTSGSLVESWITIGDQSALLQPQAPISFGTASNRNPIITGDSTLLYQTVDGFGFTLTTSSAYVINRMPAAEKASLLQELISSSQSGTLYHVAFKARRQKSVDRGERRPFHAKFQYRFP